MPSLGAFEPWRWRRRMRRSRRRFKFWRAESSLVVCGTVQDLNRVCLIPFDSLHLVQVLYKYPLHSSPSFPVTPIRDAGRLADSSRRMVYL